MKIDVTGWQEVSRTPYAYLPGGEGIVLALPNTGSVHRAVKLEGGQRIILRKP
jgi:hypothetical protein